MNRGDVYRATWQMLRANCEQIVIQATIKKAGMKLKGKGSGHIH